MAEANKNEGQPRINRKSRFDGFKDKFKGSVKFSFIFFSAVHIAKIVIAAMYFNKCPVEPDIPKYLLAMGVLGLATKLITLFKDFIIKHTKVSPLLSFITTAELTVLIVASYYVYREYEPNYYNPYSTKYCNKTLYLFSFVYITITYCLLLLVAVGICCFVFGIVLMDKYYPQDDVENATA